MPYGRWTASSRSFLLVRLVSEGFDTEFRLRRVENPHHDFLAEHRRQGTDAEVDRALTGERELHPPVLGHTLLGNVQPRNDLDAGRQAFADRQRWLRDLAQYSVDAEADAIELLVGLEVQIRCAFADRIEQQLLQESDDRCVIDLDLCRFVCT